MEDTSQTVDFSDFTDFTDVNPRGSKVNIFDDHYGSDLAARALHDRPTEAADQSTHPRQFVAQLAVQIHILACLKWLGEFQILPLIPLCGSISASDVAGLAGVPTTQLGRVVSMTATAGFLRQSLQGQIAHTTLSKAFVTDLGLLDAIMFLAEAATPTALSMTLATHHEDKGDPATDSAFAMAMSCSQTFRDACGDQERLRRQWSAFNRCADDLGDSFVELLGRMNWETLGNALIVDACAQSTETAAVLARMYPNLRFTVQIAEPIQSNTGFDGSRIMVQNKTPGSRQAITEAAVYIIHLTRLHSSLVDEIRTELNAHLGVLQANPTALLILAPPLLPEPGSVPPHVEATARLRDLSNVQMTNEGGVEFGELMEAISNVRDQFGHLQVMQKLRYRNEVVAAVTVKYQYYVNSAGPSVQQF